MIPSLSESITPYHSPLSVDSKQLNIFSSRLHLGPRQIELINNPNKSNHFYIWLFVGGGIYTSNSNTIFSKIHSSSKTCSGSPLPMASKPFPPPSPALGLRDSGWACCVILQRTGQALFGPYHMIWRLKQIGCCQQVKKYLFTITQWMDKGNVYIFNGILQSHKKE